MHAALQDGLPQHTPTAVALGFTYQCLPSKCTRRKQIKGPHHPKVAGPLNRRLGAVQSAAGLRFSQLAHLDACRYEAQPTATLR